MARGETLRNAVIGAVVSIVLGFLPFSTLLGGGVAGYLQRGSRRDGSRTGALAGLITTIPLVLVGWLWGAGIFMTLPGIDLGAVFGVGAVLAVVVLLVLVYTVGLTAIGGYLGAHVAAKKESGRGDSRQVNAVDFGH
jgi:hypothetical protein